MKKKLISHKNSGHVFWTNIDLSYHFGILRMSTFQEIIQFFNDTHVRNAIHENVCLIFYGTGLSSIVRVTKSVCSILKKTLTYKH